MLSQLEKEKVLVFTPARRVGGKRVVCYDDRYILKLASENSGIVVSNDNYRDLINENVDFKMVVEERLLMYSFVNDRWVDSNAFPWLWLVHGDYSNIICYPADHDYCR